MSEKYIVVSLDGVEEIFTFPKRIDHDRMLEGIGAVRMGTSSQWERKYRRAEAVAAGFVEGGHCVGRSETLKLNSREDIDTALLRKQRGE
jgi:hypothetical protein